MEMSQEYVTLFEALAAFLREVEPPKKNSENSHFKNKYANLESVLAAVTPTLLKHGFVLTQLLEGGDADSVTITTMLVHTSGQWMRSSLKMPAKRSPQEFGSSISYGRRYAVLAILGIAAEDDDAENGEGRGKLQRQRERSQRNTEKGRPTAQTPQGAQTGGGSSAPKSAPKGEANPDAGKAVQTSSEGWSVDVYGLRIPQSQCPTFSPEAKQYANKPWTEAPWVVEKWLKEHETGVKTLTSVQLEWAQYAVDHRAARKEAEAADAALGGR